MPRVTHPARWPGGDHVSAGRRPTGPQRIPIMKRMLRGLMLSASLIIMAGCSFTGNTFQPSGLDRVVIGRTTLQQAADDLGAQPVDVWRQGDGSVLARWAYRATAATDAVYFRQEVWLRFAPDGTFERQENAINIPLPYRPRTAQEADRAAAAERARRARQQGAPSPTTEAARPSATDAGAVPNGSSSPQALPVAAPPRVQPAAPDAMPAAAADPTLNTTLLPAGTQVIPGPAYPLNSGGR